MEALPKARYLLKLTGGEKSDVEPLVSYVAWRLEEQGMQCSVEGQHIEVCVADSATLLAQASTAALLVVFIIISLSRLLVLSGGEDEMDEATEKVI